MSRGIDFWSGLGSIPHNHPFFFGSSVVPVVCLFVSFFPCLLVFSFLPSFLPTFLVYLLACLFSPFHFNCVFLLHQSAKEWRTVFFINAAIYLVGGTFYLLFASGEKQPWANGNKYEKLTTNESSKDEPEQ